ncbi:MAG TPA: NifU family protein [Solirubrobacteraceae bacterium]|nr:NifU family protein [Solirubrobacteraceae bacterium]
MAVRLAGAQAAIGGERRAAPGAGGRRAASDDSGRRAASDDSGRRAAPDAGDALLARVQELQEAIGALEPSPAVRLADELVAAVVELYGEGLARVLARVAQEPGGAGVLDSLAADPLVSTLLLIHDLHPVALERRVRDALDSVRPYLKSHGGDVRLLSLDGGVARIALRGSCSDCAASSVTLELAIKQALEERAPDLQELIVDGGVPATAAQPAQAPPAGVWHELREAAGPRRDGELAAVTVGGHRLVIADVQGTLLAYEDRCAGCGGPLREGRLVAGTLTCPACGRAFHLPLAGRSLDGDGLALSPVPLLREDGMLRVALPG